MGSQLQPQRTRTSTSLGAVASAGRSADVAAIDFGTRALDFSDIPPEFPTGSELVLAGQQHQGPVQAPRSQPLAHITRQAPKPLRLRTGDVVQRRTSRALYPDRIVEAVAERPLTNTPGASTYRPDGSWHLAQRITHELPAKAKRTKGNVPADPPNPNTLAAGTPTPTREELQFPEGADAIAYLPAQVRRHIYALIPTPTEFDGKVVQYEGDRHYEVVVFRADYRTGIAVTATRPEQSTSWDVTMLTYDLESATTTKEGRA